MTRSSEIGRAARAKGIRAERQLGEYLRQWWPDAERSVVTGARSGDHVRPDPGDITGVPGLTFQLKYVAHLTDREVDAAMDEAEDQAVTAGSDFAILVQRRQGKADPGRWWAWMPLGDLCHLAAPQCDNGLRDDGVRVMTRLLVGDLVSLLVDAGYGKAG